MTLKRYSLVLVHDGPAAVAEMTERSDGQWHHAYDVAEEIQRLTSEFERVRLDLLDQRDRQRERAEDAERRARSAERVVEAELRQIKSRVAASYPREEKP